MATIGDRIKAAREARGLSQAELAKVVGISQPAMKKIESGQTVKSRYLADLARYLGLSPIEVPLVGYVSAGRTHFFAEGQGPFEMVPGPADAGPKTVAVEIRGESMGELFDRWLVFYDEVRRPITEDLIGKLCVVGLLDDRVMVKQVKRSKGSPFLFHLISQTEPPITDVQIAWAAPVRGMAPRS